MAPPRRPRIYFSFRSPYSWLAVHDLTQRHPEVVRAAEWRPFWEPDAASEEALKEAGGRFVYAPMSREKHLYMLGDVRRLATRRGLAVTWPDDRDAWWEVAHLAYLVAADEGRGMEFIARVHRARWQEGRDISDPRTVAALAADAGVSPAAARAVHDEQLRGRGVAALLDLDADSVFGVPFFVYGRQKFWGVDRVADFVAALGTQRQSAPGPVPGPVPDPALDPEPSDVDPATLTAARSSDYGHAGGCG